MFSSFNLNEMVYFIYAFSKMVLSLVFLLGMF